MDKIKSKNTLHFSIISCNYSKIETNRIAFNIKIFMTFLQKLIKGRVFQKEKSPSTFCNVLQKVLGKPVLQKKLDLVNAIISNPVIKFLINYIVCVFTPARACLGVKDIEGSSSWIVIHSPEVFL